MTLLGIYPIILGDREKATIVHDDDCESDSATLSSQMEGKTGGGSEDGLPTVMDDVGPAQQDDAWKVSTCLTYQGRTLVNHGS